jgi:hypothetical protein
VVPMMYYLVDRILEKVSGFRQKRRLKLENA